MKVCLGLLTLALLAATPQLAARTKCEPPPLLRVADVRTVQSGGTLRSERAIEGKVTKDGKPLPFAEVRLISGDKLVQHTTTDRQGRFLLENPSLGRYRLWFKGVGAFDVEVTPPHFMQQAFYGFRSDAGCLGWGSDMN